MNSVREQCPCTVTKRVYNIVHCSSLVVCTMHTHFVLLCAHCALSRVVVPCCVRVTFCRTRATCHPEVCCERMFSVAKQGQRASVTTEGSLSRCSLSCRYAGPTTLYHDRKVLIATQISLRAWEPYRDIRFFSRHSRPLPPKAHVATQWTRLRHEIHHLLSG